MEAWYAPLHLCVVLELSKSVEAVSPSNALFHVQILVVLVVVLLLWWRWS